MRHDRGMSDWETVGNPRAVTRRECPLCDWFMDEPPPEYRHEWAPGSDSITYRVRQNSAVPAALAHIVTAHPDSEVAAEVRAMAAAATPEPFVPDTGGGDPMGRLVSGVLHRLRESEEREALQRVRTAMGLGGG